MGSRTHCPHYSAKAGHPGKALIRQLAFEYIDEKDRLDAQVDHLAEIFLPVLGQSLWSYEHSQIQSTTEGILKNNVVFGVAVYDETNQVISAARTTPTPRPAVTARQPDSQQRARTNLAPSDRTNKPPPSPIEYDFAIRFVDPYDNQEHQVGRLIVYSDSSLIIERTAKTFVLTAINAIIKTIALWIIFFYVLKAYLIEQRANAHNPLMLLYKPMHQPRASTAAPGLAWQSASDWLRKWMGRSVFIASRGKAHASLLTLKPVR